MTRLPGRVLIVTDRHQAAEPLPDLASQLLDAGTRWFWLRDRDLPQVERWMLAERLAALVRRYPGAVLTVGADVALAAQVGAGGVHLRAGTEVAEARRRLGPTAFVGISAHSLAEVEAARDAGADYATLSPIFATASKPGYGPALGIAGLARAAACGLPVLALGGVGPANGVDCLAAGASGLAIMGEAMRRGAALMRDIGALAP